ncbi:MAG: hypothetical protein CTY16_10270 [Methylobacter sp.]|uniref:hypothetical protein n=1 Tax=Methylovulum miyakonense TaxID=645578 RepID=UPI0003640A5F|nr:hypothetical protein [Methylovulum miyakonense]PPD45277.1 MAG: hypothetical protein CTY16_10270 [Methylobacter sp.]
MKRSTFLTLAATVALAVGAFALFAPAMLLATKGVSSSAAEVWVREVGVILLAVGATALMVRNHEDSPTLRAFLMGNAAIQIGLFPIEILAYREGTITALSGIVPNSIIHLCLATGFIYYLAKMSRQNTG